MRSTNTWSVIYRRRFICVYCTKINRRNKGFCSSTFVWNVTYMKSNGGVTVSSAEYGLHGKRHIAYLTAVMHRSEPATCQLYNCVYHDCDIISITRRNPHNAFFLDIVRQARSFDENAFTEQFDLVENSAEVNRSQREYLFILLVFLEF